MRGRKKQENSKTKVLSFRVTDEQYDVLRKNDWLKRELSNQIKEYLDNFIMPKE